MASIAAVGVLGMAGGANAATPTPAVVQPMSYHSGTSGCFNWSWSDGNITTTVYYHNVCGSTETLDIWWKTGSTYTLHAVTAGAGVHGSIKESGSIYSIS